MSLLSRTSDNLPATRDTWRLDYFGKKHSRPAQKFPTGEKFSIGKKFSIGQNIFDQREEISKDQDQFSKGGFVYRFMEWHIGLVTWILKIISATFLHYGFPLLLFPLKIDYIVIYANLSFC